MNRHTVKVECFLSYVDIIRGWIQVSFRHNNRRRKFFQLLRGTWKHCYRTIWSNICTLITFSPHLRTLNWCRTDLFRPSVQRPVLHLLTRSGRALPSTWEQHRVHHGRKASLANVVDALAFGPSHKHHIRQNSSLLADWFTIYWRLEIIQVFDVWSVTKTKIRASNLITVVKVSNSRIAELVE